MVDIESTGYDDSPRASGSGGSGLKLVLPSLKTVQALKGKKRKGFSAVHEEPPKKIPRPPKLKPLKEVLTRLIVQIKKKDDYAFFLQPVDISQVQGYMDVVKRPMDFGTMTTKVEKGRYRSLEEFADDVRLVTTNAKMFNPPGTIYHTEAERIEAWALEHVGKASSSVIEYETDWNIEIERDDNDGDVPPTAEKGTPMEGDDNGSVASAQTPVVQSQTQPQGGGRRRGGGAAKKPPGALSESLEDDGGLPGAKEGLGAFPPGTEWADLMLALKLRGKRHRTKKERLRMEKGGPPYRTDASLDFTELDNPFSVLSFFAPESLSRPSLTPLYPRPPDSIEGMINPPVNITPATTIPALTSLASQPSSSKGKLKSKPKRRHWVITRTAPSRNRQQRDEEEDADVPTREPAAEDFGTFATLGSMLSAQQPARYGTKDKLFEAIRASVGVHAKAPEVEIREPEDYWRGKGTEAEQYLRDVVYGGIDGFAYVRSLAEFTCLDEPLEDTGEQPAPSPLGVPLARWVERHIVDPLTDGRHRLLSEITHRLQDPRFPVSPDVSRQLSLSLEAYPRAALELAEMRCMMRDTIDMTPLIRRPEELYQVEEAWTGKAWCEARQRQEDSAHQGSAAEYLQYAIAKHQEGLTGAAQYDAGLLQYVLDHAANIIDEIRQRGTGDAVAAEQKDKREIPEDPAAAGRQEEEEECEEDPVMRQLRLDLLGLAKRAPLDKISRLPAKLVPETLRHIVPIIDS